MKYKNDFVHLNVHSDYSFKDGLCKIDSLVKRASNLKMSSVALTDFFSLSGIIKFVKSSYNYNIKPIIGTDINYYYNNKNNIFPLTLLVIDKYGYKNLIKLISISYKNIDGYPLINYKFLVEFNKGLIFIFPIEDNSDIGRFIVFKDFISFKKIILFWNKYIYDRIYFGISRIGKINENSNILDILELSFKLKIPLVATNKVYFIKKSDFYINKIRSAIYHGCSLRNVNKMIFYTRHQYFKNQLEMNCLFLDIPEVLKNSIEISIRCNFLFLKSEFYLPKFTLCNFNSSYKYLRYISYKNLKKKIFVLNLNKKIYFRRLIKELIVIKKMNFSDYFLIVMEFVNWAKEKKISVGPGRGSGAGSLVAYSLNITNIDPIKFDLIFERFLNLERLSMPDFDIDFCMYRRDEVLSHIEKIYGKESVSQIVTFNTMTAKSVIRDVGRVLGYSYYFVDYIAKLIPFGIDVTLKTAFSFESKLKYLYDTDSEVKKIFCLSSKLEGIIKGVSKHAGGIVISPTLVTDYCPIFYDYETNKLITQFDKNDIEYIGLVKFDILGLRTLTIIDNTIKIINKGRNICDHINISNIPLDDFKSYNILKKSDTTAIFQLESNGMKDLIKKLKPSNFKDIIDLLALFRPGPLKSGMVDNYINRKNKIENIYYPDKKFQHDLLIPILKDTYGVILYQEQIMLIARIFADYSLQSADMLRIAMVKKNYDEIKEHKKKFFNKSVKLGIKPNISLKIFLLIEKFSSYGFNKSHSVSYALIAYQTLWLKANFISEYIVSFMNSDIDNIDKIVLVINEIKKKQIKIIPPNINDSYYYFIIDSNKNIIYGIGAIKGLGKNSVEYIINIRSKNGKFKNFLEFCLLTYSKKINKNVLEKLILSGVFDIFKNDRFELLDILPNVIKYVEYKNKFIFNKQLSILNFDSYIDVSFLKKLSLHNNIKYSEEYKLSKEREVLGLYLTNHPINLYIKDIYKKYINLVKIKDLCFLKVNTSVVITGIIVSIKFLSTRNKNRICIIIIDDSYGCIEILIFKDIYILYSNCIDLYNTVVLYGYLKNFYNNKYNFTLIVSKIYLFNLFKKK